MAHSAYIRRTNITVFVIVIAALLTTLLASTSRAEKRHGPCADDVSLFCKDVRPGGGHMAKCLWEHMTDISPGCKEQIMAVKHRRQVCRKACKDDVLSFCRDLKPGDGRPINCLREHENELAPDCRVMMEKRKIPKINDPEKSI